MSSFSSAGFSSAGFSAEAGVSPLLTRAAAEVLGSYPESTIHRVAIEAIVNDAFVETTIHRAVLEVLGDPVPAVIVESSRIVVEVLQHMGYAPPQINPEVTRACVEVLGSAAGFTGKRAVASRVALEVLGAAGTVHRGMRLTNPVAVGTSTLLMAVTLPTASAGAWGLVNDEGDGYLLTWAAGASTALLRAKFGTVIGTKSIPTGTRQVVRMPGTGAVTDLTQLGLLRPNDEVGSAEVHEVLLYDGSASALTLDKTENYLVRRWLLAEAGRTPCDDLPPQSNGIRFFVQSPTATPDNIASRLWNGLAPNPMTVFPLTLCTPGGGGLDGPWVPNAKVRFVAVMTVREVATITPPAGWSLAGSKTVLGRSGVSHTQYVFTTVYDGAAGSFCYTPAWRIDWDASATNRNMSYVLMGVFKPDGTAPSLDACLFTDGLIPVKQTQFAGPTLAALPRVSKALSVSSNWCPYPSNQECVYTLVSPDVPWEFAGRVGTGGFGGQLSAAHIATIPAGTPINGVAGFYDSTSSNNPTAGDHGIVSLIVMS